MRRILGLVSIFVAGLLVGVALTAAALGRWDTVVVLLVAAAVNVFAASVNLSTLPT